MSYTTSRKDVKNRAAHKRRFQDEDLLIGEERNEWKVICKDFCHLLGVMLARQKRAQLWRISPFGGHYRSDLPVHRSGVVYYKIFQEPTGRAVLPIKLLPGRALRESEVPLSAF
ncbi:uncharacterized protein LOC144069088 [Stigmatopora argus]